jgi:hypothetical protein
MSALTKFEYVNGTSGKPEYLVVAHVGRCVVAVKPEIVTESKQRLVGVGMRVRVCGDPQLDLLNDPLTATEIAKTLPHISMPNTDETRGSFSMQQAFKIPLDETLKQGAINRANHKDTVLAFAKALAKNLKIELAYSEQEIADFLQQKWERQAMKIGASENDVIDAKKTADEAIDMLKKLGFNVEAPKPDDDGSIELPTGGSTKPHDETGPQPGGLEPA